MNRLLLIALFGMVQTIYAQPANDKSLTIYRQRETFYLGPYVYVFRDSLGKHNLASVSRIDSLFHPMDGDVISMYKDHDIDVYWLRVSINNQSDGLLEDVMYFHAGIDSIQIYADLPGGEKHRAILSYRTPTSEREVHVSHELVARIDLPPGTTTFRMRVVNKSLYSKEMGAITLNLADRDSFMNYFLKVRFFHGLAVGMLLVMMIFHFFIYLFFGGRTYLFFVLNLFATILYLLSHKYYHQELSLLAPFFDVLRYVHDPIVLLLAITLMLFTQSFLNTVHEDKPFHRAMNFLMIASTVIIFITLSFGRLQALTEINIYLGIITSLLVMASSVRSYRRGNRYALYAFFGFMFYLLVPFVYLLPMPDVMHYRNNESDYLFYAEAFRALIFAIGIADQFNGVRKSAIKAEQERNKMIVEKNLQLQNERERISRELHDNIGSQITNLSLSLNSLEAGAAKSYKMFDLQDQVEQIMIQLRNTIWVIERDEIQIDELEIKIRNTIWQFQKANESIRFEVTILANPTETLTASQAVNILRIIQESVHNSVKHARANNIWIQLEVTKARFILHCEDDGIGFHSNTEDFGHYGISNMRKRAAEVDGVISFNSLPGRGAAVHLEFPIKKAPL